MHTEVLVQGAGPVGLFAALWLTERGIGVEIVDKFQRAALHSYALALHPEALRLLERLGLAQTLIREGQRVDRIRVHGHGELAAEIDITQVAGPHPFVLVVPQSVLEGALEQRLLDKGVRVRWGHPVLTFDNDGDGVTALVGKVVDRPEVHVSSERIHADFLIAADGCDSMARRTLGIGSINVGQPLVYGLVEFNAPIESCDRMELALGSDTTDVLWPLGPDHARWSLQLDDPDGPVDTPHLTKLIRRRAPWFSGGAGTVEWVTSVGFQPHLAQQFGGGRVWLAGDAARMTSPIGIQNMNIGFREVHDLAQELVEILRHGQTPESLMVYDAERRHEWSLLLGIEGRLRQFPDAPAWTGELGPRIVSALPASGRDLDVLLGQVGLRLAW